MRRLSKSIDAMTQHYDAVVVGSGYGGAIAASRLARMGKRVCVLERGKEHAIGDFPNTALEATREFQATSDDWHFGSKLGLYDLRMGDDMHVMVGCGLGGTSLINANVSLPPDPRVWKDPQWPEEIVGDTALETGFARAKRMLRPVPYPNKVELPKLKAMETAAEAMGHTCTRPPINVTFSEELNPAGVVQPACTLCGDCCSGCNVGSKSTTQVTYLPDAVNHGAEIFTETLVRTVRKERGKWRVFFELTGHNRGKFGAPDQSVAADIVVLAAGTLGSTEILMRSKDEGLALSDKLGQRFTGNGDVLAFGYNNDVPINGIGFGEPPRVEIDAVGPTISGLIDLRDTEEMTDGFVIEEGALPSGMIGMLPMLTSHIGGLFGKDTDFSLADTASEVGRQIQSRLFGAYKGAVHHTQTFLVMSHDDGAGRMELKDDRVRISWPGVGSQPNFARVDEKLEATAAATGGTYVKNPISHELLQEKAITVHPLGGCIVGRDRSGGVVNHKCQVFDADPARGETAVHDGLYVCDGAVIPRPLGVNPLLTISALAERAMIYLSRDLGVTFDDRPQDTVPKWFAGATYSSADRPVGVEFTERMAGFVSTIETASYEAGAEHGRVTESPLSFTLTILVEDIDRFIEDRDHTGAIVGSVECPALSAEPLDVSDGVFNLMREEGTSVDMRQFNYNMTLSARDGTEYRFEGHKKVHDDAGIDMWNDTTKLFVTVYKGRKGDQGIAARGIINIKPTDFAIQLQTMKGVYGKGPVDRLQAVAKFGLLFGSTLFDIYGGILARSKRFDPNKVRKKRDLRTGPPEHHSFLTEDGKTLRLTRYQGGEKGPLIFSHGLGVSSQIFSTDLIDTNMLEYFFAAGYDCWLLDFRASVDLDYCREQWTADDVARYDYPAAVAKVCEITKKDSVQMLVHCFGSTTFMMSMLGGWLKGVRSAVVSQIAADVIVPWFPQRLLAHLRLPNLFSALGIDVVNARATTEDGFAQRFMDFLIRIFVPFQREERTRYATSNRITALYGQLYELDQLNKATAETGLAEMFGEANITAFKQLALIARRKQIVTHEGEDAYIPHMERLAIPISFVQGAENACFRPASTAKTLERLAATNDPNLYERHLIAGYGHIDCIFGKDAVNAVYPLMRKHLDKTA